MVFLDVLGEKKQASATRLSVPSGIARLLQVYRFKELVLSVEKTDHGRARNRPRSTSSLETISIFLRCNNYGMMAARVKTTI